MRRSSLVVLIFFILTTPTILSANDNLAVLEKVVSANAQTQPGLQNYQVTVETSRIEEMMTSMTAGMPADVTPPAPPVIVKFWQRNGEGLVFAKQESLSSYVEKMVKRLSANMAIELHEMILPAAQTESRRKLLKTAKVKSSEVSLADQLIQRLEITFNKPTDLNGAFYVSGMRLPQKQVNSLTFDIDTKTNTVNELLITVDNGLQLTVEIRYLEVVGGYIPERFQITSPDGKVEDIFETTLAEVDNFVLPTSMLRTIRRPQLQEKLEVFFKDYQINQPISEDIQTRLKEKHQE
jgi:hypothetical protein